MHKETQKLSYWLTDALRDENPAVESLDGSISADVCIVGGGFTGLWSAIEIKQREPSARVVIVERGLCGSGASGRNGGIVLSLWAKFLSLQKMCGTEEALRLARLSSEAVKSIGQFCSDNAIDAEYRMSGWLWAATSAAQVGTWAETLDAIEAAGGEPFARPGAGEIATVSGSERHVGGILEPVAACIQPAKLAFGLRRKALALGVRIFENTPMLQLQKGAQPQVVCPHGTIRADRVIIALNAWGVMLREIRKAIAVVSSDIVVSAPATEFLKQCGWHNGPAISDSRMLVHYYRTTRDDRIVFGKGGGSGTLAFGAQVGPEFDGPSPIRETVEQQLAETYPGASRIPVEQSWTGPIDRSRNGLPMFGQLQGCPQVLYGVGYSGNGIGPSVLGGRILASLALDLQDEWSAAGLVQPLKRAFPPEPFRFAGGKIVRSAVASRDDAYDAGRRPGLFVRTVAGLAPGGLSPIRDNTPA